MRMRQIVKERRKETVNRQKSDDAFSRVKEITDQLEQGVKELFESIRTI